MLATDAKLSKRQRRKQRKQQRKQEERQAKEGHVEAHNQEHADQHLEKQQQTHFECAKALSAETLSARRLCDLCVLQEHIARLEESLKKTAASDVDAKAALSCAICVDILQTPQILACGHSFCFDCIHSWLSSIPQKSKRCCPTCRFKLTSAPALNLALTDQINSFIVSQTDRVDQQKAQQVAFDRYKKLTNPWEVLFPGEVAGASCTNCGLEFADADEDDDEDDDVIGVDELDGPIFTSDVEQADESEVDSDRSLDGYSDDDGRENEDDSEDGDALDRDLVGFVISDDDEDDDEHDRYRQRQRNARRSIVDSDEEEGDDVGTDEHNAGSGEEDDNTDAEDPRPAIYRKNQFVELEAVESSDSEQESESSENKNWRNRLSSVRRTRNQVESSEGEDSGKSDGDGEGDENSADSDSERVVLTSRKRKVVDDDEEESDERTFESAQSGDRSDSEQSDEDGHETDRLPKRRRIIDDDDDEDSEEE
ncbi:hypothetical protein BDR26DRAFT_849727 [Obelidium mucronatum]|nr:hypothetical protein BDR26DRAFT_849727 [Obelidium mucronatum]